MRRSAAWRSAWVIAAVSVLAACGGHESPTDPSTVQPVISSITPGALQPSDVPQTISFAGTGFDAAVQLIVTEPNGGNITVQGAAIQSPQPTTFQATFVLSQTGTYSFMVRNGSGASSASFTTVVQPAGAVLPVIYAVTPSSVPRNSTQATLVALQGANFAPNAAVVVTDPNGTVMILTAVQLSLATDTNVQFTFTFSIRGTYSLVVLNPSGDSSNPVFLTVT